MLVWTFTFVDPDLLREDPLNEAQAMLPLVVWMDKEKARIAAQEDFDGLYFVDDGEEMRDMYQLQWASAEEQYPTGSERGTSSLVQDQVILYPLEIQDYEAEDPDSVRPR
jgi:hypothetical protein